MNAPIPTGVAVNFDTSTSVNTQSVPGGNTLLITVSGADVYVTCGYDATASDPDGVWQNILCLKGTLPTIWRRPTNSDNDFVSVIAVSGSGTCQIVPVEGNY